MMRNTNLFMLVAVLMTVTLSCHGFTTTTSTAPTFYRHSCANDINTNFRHQYSFSKLQMMIRPTALYSNADDTVETPESNNDGTTTTPSTNEQSDETVSNSSDLPVSSSSSVSGMDILNSPQFLNRKKEVLVNDLQTLQNEVIVAKEVLQQNQNEWSTQLSDLQKEYELIQQRMNTQSNASNDLATSQVVRSMLAVLDNFDRAFGQVTPTTDDEVAIENEYKQVYQTILSIFTKLGVEEVPTVGTEFNYEIHQAVMQKPSEEYAEGIVCEELQKGFQINKTLIRAAMVAVAM